ncbi:MAG: hypothetical protein U9R21_03725 [Candidatus Thermoplasmatota archaeon]|nr:hypothetical protein [Candidatus Thermoplasmatota archaeon]
MISLRQLLCKYFCGGKDEPEKPFTTLRRRYGRHIRLVLGAQYPNASIRIADSQYDAPLLSEFQAWLKRDNVSELKFHAEHHDCDDYARALRCKMFNIGRSLDTSIAVAYCEGRAGTGYPAFNLLIDDMDAIYIIEPQSDKVVLAVKSKYKPDFIQI